MELSRRQRRELERALWKVRSHLAAMERHALHNAGAGAVLNAGKTATVVGKTALGVASALTDEAPDAAIVVVGRRRPSHHTQPKRAWPRSVTAMMVLVCAAAGGAVTTGVVRRRRRGRQLKNPPTVDATQDPAVAEQGQEANRSAVPTGHRVRGSAG
jgi:hypothetical protein